MVFDLEGIHPNLAQRFSWIGPSPTTVEPTSIYTVEPVVVGRAGQLRPSLVVKDRRSLNCATQSFTFGRGVFHGKGPPPNRSTELQPELQPWHRQPWTVEWEFNRLVSGLSTR